MSHLYNSAVFDAKAFLLSKTLPELKRLRPLINLAVTEFSVPSRYQESINFFQNLCHITDIRDILSLKYTIDSAINEKIHASLDSTIRVAIDALNSLSSDDLRLVIDAFQNKKKDETQQ